MSFNGNSITLLAHDYETTGLVIKELGVCQSALCIARMEQDGSFTVVETDVTYLNPGVAISPEASQINGITDLDVMDAPEWEPYLREQMQTVNEMNLDAVVSFNGNRFDNQIARRVGWRSLPSLDVYRYASIMKKAGVIDSVKLTSTYQFFFGKELAKAHDALADVTATLELVKPMLEHSGTGSLDAFHKLCQGDDGTGEMKIGFGAHKGKKVKHIPRDYVKWLLSDKCDMDLTFELRTALENSL